MHKFRARYLSAIPVIHSLKSMLRGVVSSCLLALLLSACDGGIFGTGDGSDVIIPDNVEGVDTADGSTDGQVGGDQEQPGAGDTQDPDEADGGESSNEEEAGLPVRAFENLDIASNRETPLLSMINLSQLPVTVFSDTQTAALFDPAVQSGQIASVVEVPLTSQFLRVLETDGNSSQLLLSPLNLGASSVSTLIVRDAVTSNQQGSNTDDPETLIPTLDILALPSHLLPSNDALARVRLLQAYAIDGDERSAEMTLFPGGDNPGGGEVSLGSVSPASFQQAPTYREVAAGNYELRDSLQRFTPVPLTLDAAQSYTLVITGNESVLMVVLDSNSGN